MNVNRENNEIRQPAISRRSFMKYSLSAAGAALLSCGDDSQSPQNKTVIKRNGTELLYSSDFIPDGSLFKLAFVADHHYWPNHYKNWGNKQFRHTEERMRDLIVRLNDEAPDISIHGGDVIDAGTAFEPPPDEYIRQLDYEKEFLDGLNHPSIPIAGNHEVPDAHYESESELDMWKERFGPLYRFTDIGEWRLICLNSMVTNPNGMFGPRPVYGVDDVQLAWLVGVLDEAAKKAMNVLLFAHIPPSDYSHKNDIEKVIASHGCIKGMMCGHKHKNYRYAIGDVPVMVRASNVASPLGYTMVYPYPDGRFVVVQKSQHFPFIDYMSNSVQDGLQGPVDDRYFTIGGSSELHDNDISVVGKSASARIHDGHLELKSENGKGFLLIDKPMLANVRISFSAAKEGATRMGVVACANSDCSNRIEGVLTSEYGPDGNMYLASYQGNNKETLDVSWFNISDGIAYGFVMEARNDRITMSPRNMPELAAAVVGNPSGKFGFFVENGRMFVTDLKLEKLT